MGERECVAEVPARAPPEQADHIEPPREALPFCVIPPGLPAGVDPYPHPPEGPSLRNPTFMWNTWNAALAVSPHFGAVGKLPKGVQEAVSGLAQAAPLSAASKLPEFMREVEAMVQRGGALLGKALEAITQRPMHEGLKTAAKQLASVPKGETPRPTIHFLEVEGGPPFPVTATHEVVPIDGPMVTLKLFDPSGKRLLSTVIRPGTPAELQADLLAAKEGIEVNIAEVRLQAIQRAGDPSLVRSLFQHPSPTDSLLRTH